MVDSQQLCTSSGPSAVLELQESQKLLQSATLSMHCPTMTATGMIEKDNSRDRNDLITRISSALQSLHNIQSACTCVKLKEKLIVCQYCHLRKSSAFCHTARIEIRSCLDFANFGFRIEPYKASIFVVVFFESIADTRGSTISLAIDSKQSTRDGLSQNFTLTFESLHSRTGHLFWLSI